jgi:hypothetical protein
LLANRVETAPSAAPARRRTETKTAHLKASRCFIWLWGQDLNL